MKDRLLPYLTEGTLLKMIYRDRTGLYSERRIKLRSLGDDSFTAFCFKRGALRTFHYDHIVSIAPVRKRKKRTAFP